MKLPRLFVGGVFKRIVHPVSVMITQNIIPLSTASMILPIGEELPARSYVELFTPYGSAGMYRVRNPQDAYGQETTTAELEHMISEVGDWIVKEEIKEMLPASTAMRRIFKHYKGGKWKLGSLSDLGTKSIACEANYDRVLDGMLSLLEQTKSIMMAFDFTTSPWTINFVKKGTKVSAEGRLSRNVTSAVISCDDTELCTRVWYQTYDKNKNATWKSKDADTITQYGVVEGTVRTSADMTPEEITATVNAYLADHKAPRVTVNIQGVELSTITGESMDKFVIGKLYRLALPDYGLTLEDHITSIVWQDVYGNPNHVTINVGDEEDTVVTFLHNLDAKGSGGSGGGKAKDQKEKEWSQYIVEWDKNKDNIAGMVAEQTRQGEILSQAGMTIDKNGILQYARNKKTNIMYSMDLEHQRIDLVVEGSGNGAKVKKASILLAINDGKSLAKISADQVDLGKYATVENLNAKVANIDKFFTGDATAKKMVAGRINVLTLQVNGVQTVWRFFDLDGTRHWYLGMS